MLIAALIAGRIAALTGDWTAGQIAVLTVEQTGVLIAELIGATIGQAGATGVVPNAGLSVVVITAGGTVAVGAVIAAIAGAIIVGPTAASIAWAAIMRPIVRTSIRGSA